MAVMVITPSATGLLPVPKEGVWTARSPTVTLSYPLTTKNDAE